MTKDEALKQALEALENISTALREDDVLGSDSELMLNAITAIKEALAQPDHIRDATKMTAQPEQEPVARVIDNGTPEGATEWIPFTSRVEPLKTGDLLYTTPPQRPWVGLTDEDRAEIDQGLYPTWKDEVQAIEAKLKEKNA